MRQLGLLVAMAVPALKDHLDINVQKERNLTLALMARMALMVEILVMLVH